MITTLLLDLDGTLTDPAEGIFASVRHALTQLGEPHPDEARLRGFIGPPLQDSFARLLPGADKARVWEAVERYRDYFRERGMFENRVYEGIPEALGALASRFTLHVATSKPETFARQIVEHFGLAAHFKNVYGSRLEGALSWKADLIAYVLDEEGLSPYECLMVGDRAEDMRGATENRLRAMGALWGYGSADELNGAGAERLLASPAELAGILAEKP